MFLLRPICRRPVVYDQQKFEMGIRGPLEQGLQAALDQVDVECRRNNNADFWKRTFQIIVDLEKLRPSLRNRGVDPKHAQVLPDGAGARFPGEWLCSARARDGAPMVEYARNVTNAFGSREARASQNEIVFLGAFEL